MQAAGVKLLRTVKEYT